MNPLSLVSASFYSALSPPTSSPSFASLVPLNLSSFLSPHPPCQAAERKKKMDKDDEEKLQEAIEEQIARALASKKVCQ